MKRYYLSHPYTGNEAGNKADSDRIRAKLKDAYPDVCFMNPLGMFGNKDTDYCTALADAMELLSVCDGVIFCPGWEESTGCRAEKAFAIQQGIKIMYLEDFCHKQTELNLAKGILDRVAEDYPTMFHEDGFIKNWGYGAMKTCPTRVKEELRLVRRLLLEVEKAL